MKIDFLKRTNISTFLEGAVDSSMKYIESSKLLEEDGVVNALPWGKLVKYFAQKLITIEDKNLAFQKAISFTYFRAFTEAIEKYKISLGYEESYLNLFKNSTLKDYKLADFDLNNFTDNKVLHIYKIAYNQLLKNENIDETNVFKVNKHIDTNLRIYFYEIVEQNRVLFKSLIEYVNSIPYKLYQEKYQLEKYYASIKNEFIEPLLNDPKGMSLNDIYIEPDFRIHRSNFHEKDKRIESNRESFVRISDNNGSIHTLVGSFFNNQISLNLRVGNPNILLILGYPGQGKSSFCKKVLNDILANDLTSKTVFYLKLRKIIDTRQLIADPLESLRANFEDDIGLNVTISDLKKSIIVLDGLDELYMKEGLSIADIDSICTDLIRGVADNSEIKIILTSRYGYIDLEKLSKRSLLIAQLEPFDYKRQVNWLKIYKNFHPQTKLSINKIKEINKVESLRHIRELIKQPILLHMVATSNINIDSDANRAAIYDMLFSTLIERNWATEGQIEILKNIEKDDLRDLIGEIALTIFHYNKGYINKSELHKLKTIERLVEKSDIRAVSESLKITMIAFYFQEVRKTDDDKKEEDKSDYAIEFLHKSLQEYMVSEKIWKSFQEFTFKTPDNRRYYIDSVKSAAGLISYLFSSNLLTSEIVRYLIEIVDNDNKTNKEEMARRLEYFLGDFLRFDFLLKEFQLELIHKQSPVDQINNNFYGYWTIISNLGVKRNFVPEELKDNFAYLIRCFTSTNRRYTREFFLNFSYQDLSETDLSNMECIHINLNNCNLSGTNLLGVGFETALLNNCSFNNTLLSRSSFIRYIFKYDATSDTDIINNHPFDEHLESISISGASFKKIVIPNEILSHAIASEIDFTGSNFNGTVFQNIKFINCNLSNVHFDTCIFLDAIFVNCKIDGASFLGSNFYSDPLLTYEQLSKVSKLYGAKGLDLDLINRLSISYPNLFDDDLPF